MLSPVSLKLRKNIAVSVSITDRKSEYLEVRRSISASALERLDTEIKFLSFHFLPWTLGSPAQESGGCERLKKLIPQS